MHMVSPLWTVIIHANTKLCGHVGGPTGGIVKGFMEVDVQQRFEGQGLIAMGRKRDGIGGSTEFGGDT